MVTCKMQRGITVQGEEGRGRDRTKDNSWNITFCRVLTFRVMTIFHIPKGAIKILLPQLYN